MNDLRMRDVVERTGVGEATLRAWESRYGFPKPKRLASGHRRYDDRDVELVRQVAQLRDAGIPLTTAVEQARQRTEHGPRSVFAAIRRFRPQLHTAVLPKRSLIAISHAIEDESARGTSDLLLFGAFQHVRHYRASEPRWRDLARAAEHAFVFADFDRPRRPRHAPVEVPIPARDPLEREWVVVADSSDGAACMVGWEPPGQDATPDRERVFETIWTADRATARHAAQVCCGLAEDAARDLVAPIDERLAEPVPPAPDELRRAEALTARMIAYLAR